VSVCVFECGAATDDSARPQLTERRWRPAASRKRRRAPRLRAPPPSRSARRIAAARGQLPPRPLVTLSSGGVEKLSATLRRCRHTSDSGSIPYPAQCAAIVLFIIMQIFSAANLKCVESFNFRDLRLQYPKKLLMPIEMWETFSCY